MQELEKFMSSMKRENSNSEFPPKQAKMSIWLITMCERVKKMWETQESRDVNLDVVPRRVFPTDGIEDGGKLRCPSQVTPHRIQECGGNLSHSSVV
jgi:hypothetical protein